MFVFQTGKVFSGCPGSFVWTWEMVFGCPGSFLDGQDYFCRQSVFDMSLEPVSVNPCVNPCDFSLMGLSIHVLSIWCRGGLFIPEARAWSPEPGESVKAKETGELGEPGEPVRHCVYRRRVYKVVRILG